MERWGLMGRSLTLSFKVGDDFLPPSTPRSACVTVTVATQWSAPRENVCLVARAKQPAASLGNPQSAILRRRK